MSLKNKIAAYLAQYRDWDSDTDLVNGILALVRAHMTSEEAVERSLRATAERLWTGLDGAVGNVAEAQRAAILAALGNTHD